MWLGKVVNSVDLGGACKKKYVGKAQHIKGTCYDGGDWRVAVVSYERAGDDDERLTFCEPPSDAGVDFSTALSSASSPVRTIQPAERPRLLCLGEQWSVSRRGACRGV